MAPPEPRPNSRRWVLRAWIALAFAVAAFAGWRSSGQTGDVQTAIAVGVMVFLVAMVAYFMVTALVGVIRDAGAE